MSTLEQREPQDQGASSGPGCEPTASAAQEVVFAESHPSREHCTFADIGTATPDTPPELLARLDEYFSAFARPIKTENSLLCLSCDKPLTGLLGFFMGGGFTWGSAHGEGHCSACHWPARAHHFIKDADGSDLVALHNVVLQYHPDYVERRNAAKAQGGEPS